MNRKKQYQPETFEARGIAVADAKGVRHPETFVQLFESMLLSPAFFDLTMHQRQLYLICKAQYYGKRKPKHDYPETEELQSDSCFYLSFDQARRYCMYTDKSSSLFYRDMKALIEHGFVDKLASGQKRHSKTVYRYSDRWQTWQKK